VESFFLEEKPDSFFHFLRLSDIQKSLVERWRNLFLQSDIDPNTKKLLYRWDIDSRYSNHGYLLNIIREIISTNQLNSTSSHVFIVTDEEGTVLETFGTELMMQRLEEINLGKGTSLALKHTGINGVSIAVELKSPVIVKGDEHDLALFSGWTCICAPIFVNNNAVAFINLSFHINSEVTFAIPFLRLLSNKVQEKLFIIRNNVSTSNAKINKIFDAYQFTSREKEIAVLWLRNKSYSEIASELYLSCETVRCHIKKIHQKTGAKNKVDFITKFTMLCT